MKESAITETALYLTFKLDEELYAIDVSQVREILDLTGITRVPQSADYMRGVINVRGSVIPVIDLKLKFGMQRTESSKDTRIVVMEIDGGDEATILGAMADSVHDVIELEPSQIESPPTIGSRLNTNYIRGIGKRNDQFIIVIDIDRVFSSEELFRVTGSEQMEDLLGEPVAA